MTDIFSKAVRRKVMQSAKSKNTQLENNVCKGLWKKGYRFRRNVGDLLGKPDLSIKKYKVVIFLDSCFWHGCIKHCRIPETNTEYWRNKINKNRNRDKKITVQYKKNGWNILRIWEHELKTKPHQTHEKITMFIDKAKKCN